ncbi:2-amino-4-hydroxy-6-hydroxymethyldihydropteridine diphosphokinase [bacterium]|nr:2-amino-4-hydroxy-6-hydroxymethyldihydropteridine diphosphokinase [bacterium]
MQAGIYIGLGSNLGDRRGNIKEAIDSLRAVDSIEVKKISSVYETEPEGLKDQPHFLNCALEVETKLSPGELLAGLKAIEGQMGRSRGKRWGPRIIDLDILLYGDLVMKEADLEIPHPLLPERLFVLSPLCEIAPEIIHPALGRSIRDLRKQLEEKKLK